MLRVIDPGPFTTVQDNGRVGRAHQGIARSGAADQHSKALANRLVGNDANAAVLEITFGPASFLTVEPVVIAVTGAICDVSTIDARGIANDAGTNVAVAVKPGARIHLTRARDGLRTYVAVRGGILAEVVLGSRSYDTLGRIGPAPLVAGDELAIGIAKDTTPWFEVVPVAPPQDPAVVDVHLGPRDDWLAAGQGHRLLGTTWSVAVDSNRTGIRLLGAQLTRRPGEIPTEAMMPGAVQLPMDGRPIILGPDCGTTGGYPVIAVLTAAGLDRVGQLRPGDRLCFRALNRSR